MPLLLMWKMEKGDAESTYIQVALGEWNMEKGDTESTYTQVALGEYQLEIALSLVCIPLPEAWVHSRCVCWALEMTCH